MDCSPPGSSVHGISQARILEWVAISSSRGSSWPRDGTQDRKSTRLNSSHTEPDMTQWLTHTRQRSTEMNTSLSGSKLMLCAPSPTVSIQIAVQQQGDHALSGLWFGIMQINQVLIRGSKRGRKINLILLKVLMERKIQVFCSFSLMFFFPTLYSCPFFFFSSCIKILYQNYLL